MKKGKPSIAYGPRFDTRGAKHARWIENASRGLRFVGFADDVARAEGSRSVEHSGWYGDEFGDTLFRGVVYALPSRGGLRQFAYGYTHTHNDDDCAVLCFDLDADNPLEAARFADRMAELVAETEREYQAKWQSARVVEECRERICAARRKHTALIRAIWRGDGDNAIGARLRETVRAEVCEARETIASMLAQYGDEILTAEFN